jgi:hypothetical protein
MSAFTVPAGAGVVECEISVTRAGGRPVVYCDVQHFMRSGLTAAELFAHVAHDEWSVNTPPKPDSQRHVK